MDSTGHELYLPLSTAIHVFYGRPFKYQRGIGKLDDNFIPDQFMGIHKCLITFRDKIIVHTDAETVKEAGRPLLDLVYHGRSFFSTSDPRPGLVYYKHIANYLPVIINKVHDEIEKIHDRFNNLLPKSEDDYLLNLEGDVLFTPYEPPSNRITF